MYSKLLILKLVPTLLPLLILLFLIDKFTIKTYGGGSGNLALLILPIYFIFLIWFGLRLYNLTKQLRIRLPIRIITNLILLVVIVSGLIIQVSKWKQLKITIKNNMLQRGLPVSQEYIDQVTTGLTAYTNTIYFNLITLLMIISVILLFSINRRKRTNHSS